MERIARNLFNGPWSATDNSPGHKEIREFKPARSSEDFWILRQYPTILLVPVVYAVDATGRRKDSVRMQRGKLMATKGFAALFRIGYTGLGVPFLI